MHPFLSRFSVSTGLPELNATMGIAPTLLLAIAHVGEASRSLLFQLLWTNG